MIRPPLATKRFLGTGAHFIDMMALHGHMQGNQALFQAILLHSGLRLRHPHVMCSLRHLPGIEAQFSAMPHSTQGSLGWQMIQKVLFRRTLTRGNVPLHSRPCGHAPMAMRPCHAPTPMRPCRCVRGPISRKRFHLQPW